MKKQSYILHTPLISLSLTLLFSLILLAACGTGAVSSPQETPTATSTAASDATVEEMTTPEIEQSPTATTNATGGFDCASVNQIPLTECAALVALYNSTNGPEWIDKSDWLVTNTPCTWSGIDCTEGRVSHINLLYNELKGSLPPELGNLSHLRVLALWVNQLHGPIPPELGNLSQLVSLELSDNQLTGSIPSELGNLGNLRTLTLAYNQLDGSIPPALGKIEGLESLNLSYNQFSGAIPAELGDLTDLNALQLSHNQLSGAIPVSLGSLSKLYELDLSYNRLSGSVPELVTHITQRTLWGNQLEGTITTSGQKPFTVDYMGVHFTADPSLATSIWPEVIPATPALEDAPFWYAAPEHIRFTFADPHSSTGRTDGD